MVQYPDLDPEAALGRRSHFDLKSMMRLPIQQQLGGACIAIGFVVDIVLDEVFGSRMTLFGITAVALGFCLLAGGRSRGG